MVDTGLRPDSHLDLRIAVVAAFADRDRYEKRYLPSVVSRPRTSRFVRSLHLTRRLLHKEASAASSEMSGLVAATEASEASRTCSPEEVFALSPL